jgi:hypothetical protein
MIFNSGIKFDGRWDVRSGFATHQILVVSISNRSRMGGDTQVRFRIDGFCTEYKTLPL